MAEGETISCYFDSFRVIKGYFLENEPWKMLHAKDEDVGGKGIALADALCGGELVETLPI